MPRHDVVVLGAGPGGYVAAVRASQLGLSTGIVEKRFWGGVCLNVGCIPSKALLHAADFARKLRRGAAALGLRASNVSFDYSSVCAESRRVAEGRARGVRYLMQKNRVAAYEGHATFLGPHELEVALCSGASERIEFEHAIIATGATPRRLPELPQSPRIAYYEEQILSKELPRRCVIVGAGAIGVEFATLFAAYGVEVTLVEAAPHVLPLEDGEVSAHLERRLAEDGVRVLTSTRLGRVEDTGEGLVVELSAAQRAERVRADRLLVAVGFEPNVGGFGLERTGVALTDGGAIATSPWLETSVPHVFAIGDVTGRLMLAHAAEAMGIVAAEAIAGLDVAPFQEDAIPRVTFAHPQVASFGLTEAQARAAGLRLGVAKFPFQANGKAQGIGEPSGFVKLLSTTDDDRLVGAHLIGPDVGELLAELTLAYRERLPVSALFENVHAHPTLSEAVKDAAHGLAGHYINL